MAAADKVLKALKAVAGEAKATGKLAKDVVSRTGRVAKNSYAGTRAAGKGIAESVVDAAGRTARDFGRNVGAMSRGDQARLGGLGAGGALAAMGMMSGGDDEMMAEIAERSGLPVGGDSMAQMRMAMLPTIQKKISSEVLSGRDPSRILSRIERDIYNPLARQTNELGEGEADDLYNLTEGIGRVLYADAPEQDKLAALYELAGME